MTKKFKRTISFILTIALLVTITYTQAPITVFGDENIDQGKCGPKASYVIDSEGTLTISGTGDVTSTNWDSFSDQTQKIVIEDGITSIPYAAFYNFKNVTDVIMIGSLKTIGANAFEGCAALKNITFSNKLNKIEEKAFLNCISIRNIELPDSLKTIENEVFSGCTNLNEIKMSSGIEEVEFDVFAGTAFYNNKSNWTDKILYCGNVAIEGENGISGEVNIKNGTRVIASRAFEYSNITKVTIPDNIVTIGATAFFDCKSLKSVIVEGGLKYIKDNAFGGDSLLSNLQLPETVTQIGNGAFSSCVRLVNFKTSENLTKLGASVFANCNSLEKITITKNVAIIGEKCFEGCSQLLELTSYTEATPGDYKGGDNVLTLPESLEKIYAVEGSKYETYANEKEIEFEKVNDWQINNGESEYGKYVVTKGQKDYYKNHNYNQTDYLDYANSAINKNVKVIGSNAGSSDKGNMFDGDVNSFWQKTDRVNEVYINVDLGRNITFDQIKLWLASTGLEYEINVSNDKVNYETVMYVTNPYSSTRTDEIYLDKSVTARYVQFKTLYKHDNSDIFYEIGVYGKKGQIEYTAPVESETTTPEESTTIPTEVETTDETITTGESTTVAQTTETTTQGSVETTTEATTTTGVKETTTTPHTDETGTTPETGETTTPDSQTTSGQNETTSTKATDNQETTGHAKIKLTAPKIKRLKEKDYHSTEIKWSKSGDKCSYIVYRSTNAKKNYKKIGTTSNLQYTDKTVKAGTTYFYKIKAICGNVESQSTVKKISIKGRPLKPRLTLKMTQKAIKIKWGIIKDNSKGIQVYVKSTSGGYKKYTKIYATTNLKHSSKKKGATGIESSKKGLKKGSTYQFKIRTYAIVNKKKVYSLWSNVKKIKIK